MKNIIKNFQRATLLFIGVVITGIWTSCDYGFELPEAGSVVDTSSPEAGFSYTLDPDDFTIVNFTDLSSESISYLWDFNGEGTSTEQDPTFTFTGGEGTYTVTLTSSDGLGVSSTVTQEVAVVPGPYQPVIVDYGFENDDTDGGPSSDSRDSWRNSDLGGVIQITSDPVASGEKGAKLPLGDERIGYQEFLVEAETSYSVNFVYTILTTPAGYVTVDILDASGGTITSQEDAASLVLGSATVNNQEDGDIYENASVAFNSGSSTMVAIYFYNGGSAEARLDDFSIDIVPDAPIPPSPSFSIVQSETNYLEYTFVNTSVNATDYTWDFGDEGTSTEQSPVHVYDVAGIYTVSVTALSSETGLTAEFVTSIDIQAFVTADFTFEADADNYQKFTFTDASIGAESLMWDFGNGFQSNATSPVYTYAEDGAYTVTLTATSVTGSTSVKTAQLAISAGAIIPVINGGNMDNSSTGWKPENCTGCSTSGFNGSSDGSWYDYAGVLGTEKTPGAKYTSSTSGGEFASSSTRYGYQEVEVTPNTVYILEYEYAIKSDDGTDPSGGRRVVAEILDGYFDDAAVAVTSTKLVSSSGYIAEGKFSDTVGTRVTAEFTSNASGEIAILLWAETPVDAWFDNIKIYPKD